MLEIVQLHEQIKMCIIFRIETGGKVDSECLIYEEEEEKPDKYA
jgi:hypothetical protein